MASLYSSKTNLRLWGHEQAEARLLRDLESGRLAHGWIISGPRGIGKATLAYRFARTALTGLPASQITAEHPALLRIAAGSHTDLLVLEPLFDPKKDEFAREITISQAREVGEFLSLTAGEGQWRIVIVDPVDALNTNAANALLKILEEPPPQTLLLLISHNPGRLLPTIKSRCQQMTLSPLNENAFRDVMAHIHPEVDSKTIKALGQLSNYSPGLADTYIEKGAIDIYNQIVNIMSGLPSLNASMLHSFAEKMTGGQVHSDWQLLARLLLAAIERIALSASGASVNPASDEEAALLQRMASLHPAHIWAAKWHEAAEQFSLAERLHLDYKQLIIIFFHSLAGREEFRIGSVAA